MLEGRRPITYITARVPAGRCARSGLAEDRMMPAGRIEMENVQIWRVALLLVGVWACATAIIFIRLSKMPPMMLAGLRLVLAAGILSPLLIRDLRAHGGQFGWRNLRATMVAGLAMGGHFASWIVGARLANPTNASLIVNMAPVAMPFFLLAIARERITRGELLGTLLAMCGVFVLGAGDFRISGEYFSGDVICFISMLILCLYLTLGRRNRHFATIWLYVVPLYFFGRAASLIASLIVELGAGGQEIAWNLREILLVAAMVVIPTITGHSILNYSLKYLRGQVVGIINLFQFVFVGVMAYFILDEKVIWTIVPAAALVLAGATVVLTAGNRPDDRQ